MADIPVVDQLAERRAEKAEDSRLWSALDALASAAEDIQAEQAKGNVVKELIVYYYVRTPEGDKTDRLDPIRLARRIAGLRIPETIGMLHLALSQMVRNWWAD